MAAPSTLHRNGWRREITDRFAVLGKEIIGFSAAA